MTFLMFLSKEDNSIRANGFLLLVSVVSLHHQKYCGYAGLWKQVPLISLSWAFPVTVKKEIALWVCGCSVPWIQQPWACCCLGSIFLCTFFPFSSFFSLLTYLYLEIVYLFENMLTLHTFHMRHCLNKLHILIACRTCFMLKWLLVYCYVLAWNHKLLSALWCI